MNVRTKRSVIYKGKLYRKGKEVEIDAKDFNAKLFERLEVEPELTETPLPPLKKK